MTLTREQILAEVLRLLNSVAQDWEFDGPLTADTRLFGDLAFESLDLVVLGAKVQEHFGQTFPFPELFADIGQRDVRDLTIGEWVDFIDRHLQRPTARSAARARHRRAYEPRRSAHRARRRDVRHPRSADGRRATMPVLRAAGRLGRARDAAVHGAGADAAGLDVAGDRSRPRRARHLRLLPQGRAVELALPAC